MIEWMNEWVNGWLIDWLNDWMNEWMNERTNEWMKEWMNEPRNQWTTEAMWMNQWINEICQLHLPKLLWHCVFLRFICETELSLQSRAHFTDLIFQKCSEHDSFFAIMWNQALATVSCTLCQPHLPKVLETWQFFNMFKCKPSSRYYSPVHFLSTTFAHQGPQPRKHRPYFGDHGSHFTLNNRDFAPDSLFKPEFTLSWLVTLPIYLMMMWLTWWWECCP